MRTSSLVLVAGLALSACGGSDESAASPAKVPGGRVDHVRVDHILIGVKNPRFPPAKRDLEEARTVAHDLYAKLKAGADWDAAKREFTEDTPPGGPYGMANRGVRLDPGDFPRDQMAPAFGDVGFSLAVGELGLAEYDEKTSPFGFHIIKRIK